MTNHLGESQVQHAGWYFAAKGRMQANFLLWRDDAGFQMTLSADLQEADKNAYRCLFSLQRLSLCHR